MVSLRVTMQQEEGRHKRALIAVGSMTCVLTTVSIQANQGNTIDGHANKDLAQLDPGGKCDDFQRCGRALKL